MKYLSFDVGIKNLAYCSLNDKKEILDWGIINLDKNPSIQGKLTGIKGQYLILDNQNVFNVRKYTGYFVTINIK